MVSFGLRRKLLCEPWAPEDLCAGLGLASLWAMLLPVFGYPRWSYSYWSQKFPARLPLAFTQLSPFHGCELICLPEMPWPQAPWQSRPWALERFYDRRRPKFSICNIGIPFAQAVWSDSPWKGSRPGRPLNAGIWEKRPWRKGNWGIANSGGWSGSNAFWSCRYEWTLPEPPIWGKGRWSDGLEPAVCKRLDEFYYDYLPYAIEALNPELWPALAALYAFRVARRDAWPQNPWPDHPWLSGFNPWVFASQMFSTRAVNGLTTPGHMASFTLHAWLTDTLDPDEALVTASQVLSIRVQPSGHWPELPWPSRPWLAIHGPGTFLESGLSISFGKPEICCRVGLPICRAWLTDVLEPQNPYFCQSRQSGSGLSKLIASLPEARLEQIGSALLARKSGAPASGSRQDFCGRAGSLALEPAAAGDQILPAFAGGSPRSTSWHDGIWPEHSWTRLVTCARQQQPFAINIYSEA